MARPRAWVKTAILLASGSLLAALGNVPNAGRARADDEDVPAAPRAAVEGILVMRTGAIIAGKILRSGKIYEVQCPNGNMAVPETLVKLHAASLDEAYQKLHDGARAQHSANAHVLLAQWCLANHLDKEARSELRDALQLEPDRDDARRLLRNADETINADKKPPVAVPADPLRTARQNASSTEDAVSLGGLPREQALQFARRIQPLLMNNCTAAGCHGRDSQTGFRLQKVTPGKDLNRNAAEHNLAEVLEYIDVKQPRASALLTVPRGNHGRRGRPIFVGSRGEEQLAEMQKWVVAVAREEARGKPNDDTRGKPGKTQAASAVRDASESPIRRTETRSSGTMPAARPSSSVGPDEKPRSQPPLPTGRGDPFDPAVFNRGSDRRGGR